MTKIKLIYPEERTVTEDVIFGWYADALVNQNIVDKRNSIVSLQKALDFLEDFGFITVSGVFYENS